MLKSFRYLLFPFSIIYWCVIKLRNFLFDKNIFKSASFNFPIICIGNLAVGGTGKTPMTEFVVAALKNKYNIATLSRGYKRRTKGFAIATDKTTAIEIGDEPMQFHQKFTDVIVAVGEERIVAIPQILYQHPNTQLIVLDDAFQHRRVKAGLNIILTEYNNLFTRDIMFPSGDLRDVKKSSSRADIIIVTKCKSNLSASEQQQIISEINPLSHQKVYFTSIEYGEPYHLFNKSVMNNIDASKSVLLVCGIANPRPVMDYLTDKAHYYEMIKFQDHHIFTSTDLNEIKKQFQKISAQNKMIVTTEKDAVRLEKFKNELQDFPIYVLPIKHNFLFEEGQGFIEKLDTFINSFSK
jgi:tetraacyldisaccharide 4'-kinase